MRTRRDLSLIFLLALAACTTDRTRRGYLEENARRIYASPPERVAIVVPGFGVTRLYDPVIDRYVWGTARSTVRTRFPDDLDLPVEGRDRLVPRGYVGSRGPVNVGWQLTEALRKYGGYERDETVFPFYYDWRLSARENALQLRDFIATVRKGRRVDIVTHSAGSLVALALVKLIGGDSVENLILIAPTRAGVADAFRILVRPERFIRRRFTPDLVATWPSVPELFPEDGRFIVDEDGEATSFDVWDPASWAPIVPTELRDRFARSIERARAFRQELRDAPLPANVRLTIIAGDCVPTARRVLARDDGTYVFYASELREDEQRLQPLLFEPGDGTVPVSSARGGSDAFLFCDGHQGIVSDPNVHRALIRLLRETR
jgi:hypothetical protein